MDEFQKDELFESYMNFEGVMRRYFGWKRKEQGPRANPHRGQGRILSILKLQPEITQKEMTYLLDMRPQSLAELLTKMEKAEFITREPSEQDRRIMVVKLTDAGRAEVEKMKEVEEKSIFDILSEEEKEQFKNILDKLAEGLKEEIPEEFLQQRMDAREFGPKGRGFGGPGRHEHPFHKNHGNGRDGRAHHFYDCNPFEHNFGYE